MQNNMRAAGPLALVFTMNILFAATFPIGKLGLDYTGPLFLSSFRMILAGIVLLTYYWCTTKRIHSMTWDDMLLVVKIIIFYDILAYLLEFWSLQYMTSLKTNMLWSSLPFVSALLGYYLSQERLTTLKWWGLFIGTIGMVPMMLLPDERMTQVGAFFTISLPEFALLVAVVATSYGAYLTKRLLDKGFPLVMINGLVTLIGGTVIMTTRLALIPLSPNLYSSFYPVLFYSLLLVFISDVGAYGIYGILIRRKYSITFINFSGFLCPIFGAVFSKLIFNEQIYYHYMVAFVFIFIGLFIFYREELSQEVQREEAEALGIVQKK
jgi:drug/metabolite transporter (DMT)-like permease